VTLNLKLERHACRRARREAASRDAARVATINDAVTDGVTINPPAVVVADGLNEISQTPALIVLEGRTPRFEWEGTHGFISWTQLHVTIIEEAVARQVIARKLRRQARAVIESVWDSAPAQQLGAPAADGTRIKMLSADPGPANRWSSTGTGWRGFYVVTFLAQQIEGL
jgi:hypothetical protein